MGRLLGALRQTLDAKIRRPASEPTKLAVYACHDTSLAGILWVSFRSLRGVFMTDFFPTSQERPRLLRRPMAAFHEPRLRRCVVSFLSFLMRWLTSRPRRTVQIARDGLLFQTAPFCPPPLQRPYPAPPCLCPSGKTPRWVRRRRLHVRGVRGGGAESRG